MIWGENTTLFLLQHPYLEVTKKLKTLLGKIFPAQQIGWLPPVFGVEKIHATLGVPFVGFPGWRGVDLISYL